MELVLKVFKVTPTAASVPITAPRVPRIICNKYKPKLSSRICTLIIRFSTFHLSTYEHIILPLHQVPLRLLLHPQNFVFPPRTVQKIGRYGLDFRRLHNKHCMLHKGQHQRLFVGLSMSQR